MKIPSRVILACLVAVVIGSNEPAYARSTDWEFLGNGPDMQHHSDLAQIDQSTVGRLGLAWAVEMPTTAGLVGNPLIKDGVIFQGGPGAQIFANDLHTGRLLWHYSAAYSAERTADQSLLAYWGRQTNRGLALAGRNAIIASGDCRLIAVDQKTGKQNWEVQSCDPTQFYAITGAPRIGGGMVFIGNSCADSGATRGYVDAFDAATGQHKWRFYTVPGDPAKEKDPFYRKLARSWGTDWYSKSHGCGSVWDAMTYDAKLDQLIIGVGGPSPIPPSRRAGDAGDELFTNSVVALDARTGRYKWHAKQVPHDGWNLEPSVGLMLADLPIDGRQHRVVLSVPKQGFTYVYDAVSGKFLAATKYAMTTLDRGIDASGRFIPNPDAMYWKRPGEDTLVVPGPTGAHGWEALAFDPRTDVIFIPAITLPVNKKIDPKAVVGGTNNDYFYGENPRSPIKPSSEVVAVDLKTNAVKWRSKASTFPLNSGLLHTAGGLVFQGTADGRLFALDEKTGKALWEKQTGGAIRAAPSTVMLDDVQYLIVATGNGAGVSSGQMLGRYTSTPESRTPPRLLAFKIGGTAPYPPLAKPEPVPAPSIGRMDATLAAAGEPLFEARGCDLCHGRDGGASNGGNPPNLNRLPPPSLDVFKQIVQGGALKPNGMPQFKGVTDAEAKALFAYIINSAWDAHDRTNANGASNAR